MRLLFEGFPLDIINLIVNNVLGECNITAYCS